MTATEKRRGRVDGDLQTIVLKATHEQPERRYASAAALSDDLTRWLERRPIAARTDSLVYRARRFVARNPAATLMGTIAAASLVAGLVIVSVLVIHAGEARDRAREETRLAEGVSGFLRTVLGSIDPEMAQGRDVGLLVELLEDAGQKIEDELGDMPRAAIPLHITIGSAFKSIARYEPARDHFERAEAMSRLFMAGSLMHAEAVEALATLDLDTDRYEQARTHLATARSILEQHVETGGLVPLARVLRHTAHLERALADYQSAEATCRLALNLLDSSRHRTSLTSDWKAERAAALMEHGVLLATQWRAEEAIAAVEEAMQILLRLHGDQHPQVARASYNLGWANRRANNPEEAEYWYRQALALNQRLLHDNHPDIASSMNNLAGALEEQGEFQEAEALYVEAIERMQRILGARHVDVATAINNLGGLYRKTGRSADALRRFSEAIDIYKEVLGADHPWIAIVAESAAATLESADDLPAARTWVQECVRIRSGRHDAAEQWMLERARTLLGLCMMADGETDAGLAMLEEARAFLHAHRPEGDATRTAADRRWAAAQALLGR